MLDKFFSPDIQLKVKGEKSIVIGFMPLTKIGAEYITRNAGNMLEKPYDDIIFYNGLCVEIIEDEL
jgi:hypothetical protein